jgi:protoporphyrinogen oxidase
MSDGKKTAMIIGAGPAGLAAAHHLTRTGHFSVHLIEKSNDVGGIARTESHNGYLFDIGGHRFFSKDPAINALWQEMLGEDFLAVRRQTRICYRDRMFSYPLRLFETIGKLSLRESLLIFVSYLQARLFPHKEEKTFEQWTINHFGKRLYEMFFKTYTEKVWGIPCTEIRADWAAQRIKNLSFREVLSHAFFKNAQAVSLIEVFSYPRRGSGMMWERFAETIRTNKGCVDLNSQVVAIHHDGKMIREVTYRFENVLSRKPIDALISSVPLDNLTTLLDPLPPPEIIEASAKLRYRSFIIIILVLNKKDIFPDQWLYIHSPEVQVGRIENFGNWSSEMVPDPETTSLGLEYFCDENDALWTSSDHSLIRMAIHEAGYLGITGPAEVIDSCVVRQAKAYPVYDEHYREHVETLKSYLEQFMNLQTAGRNGTHRYNNMDLAMTSGILAAQNITGSRHDVWMVGTSPGYLEEGTYQANRINN